jgi:hypothetical protein
MNPIFRWKYDSSASYSLFEITSSLANLPNLENVNIEASTKSEKPMINVSAFSNLRSFSFTWSRSDDFTEYISREIVPVILSSPHLESLDIAYDSYRDTENTSVDDIFEPWVNAHPGEKMRLKHLGLKGIRFNKKVDPRFNELIESVFSGLDSLTISKDKCSTCSEDQQLWKALKKTGLKLHALETDVTDLESFLEYISSFEGLEKLVILGIDGKESEAAERFWKEVLPKHIETLRELTVHPHYEGDWCYGRLASEVISKGKKLEKLGLSMQYLADDDWAEKKILVTPGWKGLAEVTVPTSEKYGYEYPAIGREKRNIMPPWMYSVRVIF